MKKTNVILFLLLTVFISQNKAWSSVRYENYKGGTIKVNVKIGKTSEVIFPNAIAELLRSQVPGSVDLETKGKSLYILPKAESKADIYVRTIDDIEIPLSLEFSDSPDIQVFISDDTLKPSVNSNTKKESNLTYELLRTVINGREIPSATRTDPNQTVFENKYFKAVLRTRYELTTKVVLIIDIENLLNRTILTPIQEVHLRNLLAISADRDILAPQGKENSKSTMYLVLGK